LDPAFASIISKAMARDVSHRFQSTQEVLRALDAWLQSGQAVTVPPLAEGGGGTVHLPKGARGAMSSAVEIGAPAAGQGTAGSWATSQPDTAPAKKKSAAPLIAAAVGGTLLLLGGGALAAFALHNRAPASANSATASLPTAPTATSVVEAPKPAVTAPPAATTASAAPAASSAPAAPPASLAHPAPVHALPLAHPVGKPAPAPAKPDAPPPAPKPAGAPDFGY